MTGKRASTSLKWKRAGLVETKERDLLVEVEEGCVRSTGRERDTLVEVEEGCVGLKGRERDPLVEIVRETLVEINKDPLIKWKESRPLVTAKL